MCRCGRYPPSSGVGRADASAVRSGGSGGGGDEKNGATAGGGSRWKHKGVGIVLGSGGGGGGSSHRWPNAAGRRTEMDLNVGLLMPKTSFKVRGYLRAIHDAIQVINKAYKKNRTTNFSKIYDFEERNVRSQMMSLTPSPTGRCDRIIIYCYCVCVCVRAFGGENDYRIIFTEHSCFFKNILVCDKLAMRMTTPSVGMYKKLLLTFSNHNKKKKNNNTNTRIVGN